MNNASTRLSLPRYKDSPARLSDPNPFRYLQCINTYFAHMLLLTSPGDAFHHRDDIIRRRGGHALPFLASLHAYRHPLEWTFQSIELSTVRGHASCKSSSVDGSMSTSGKHQSTTERRSRHRDFVLSAAGPVVFTSAWILCAGPTKGLYRA